MDRLEKARIGKKLYGTFSNSLPETIYTGISMTGKGKPDSRLRQLEINGQVVLRYEGIKSGGIIFQEEGKNLEEATKKMEQVLKRYNIPV